MARTTIANLLDGEPTSSGVMTVASASATPAAQPEITTSTPLADPVARMRVRVVWGDLARTVADIHVVGHYQGVLPVSAERELDRALSPGRGIIAEHTRRRWLVGSLGEICYFPGVSTEGRDETGVAVLRAAVAGMGRLGTFNEARAEQLYTSVLREISSLPAVRSAAVVLIGSGAGNLSIPQVARALTKGLNTLLANPPANGLQDLVVVEVDRLRAEHLHVALFNLLQESPAVQLGDRVEVGAQGRVGSESAAVFAIRALVQVLRKEETDQSEAARNGSSRARKRGNPILAKIIESLPPGLREQIPERLAAIPDDIGAVSVVLGQPGGMDRVIPPTRIAVSTGNGRMAWAALTERATIPERAVPSQPRRIAALVGRLTAPEEVDAGQLPQMLRRWIVPTDFQEHINAETPLVFDVDAEAAKLPWEFLTDGPFDSGDQQWPLALRTPIARQLRTSYARASADYEKPSGLRALVIADPGPPDQRLPGAREEGFAVAKLLHSRGVEPVVYAGGPLAEDELRSGVREATELDVISALLLGKYDIVHFAGHGLLGQDGQGSGWLFADGILAAGDLVQMTWAPRLITANACWSAVGAGAAAGAGSRTEAEQSPAEQRAALTSVLADEFLRVGVAHYIGTSWEIPDRMGVKFATSLYERLLPTGGNPGVSIGQAVMEARQVLFSMKSNQVTPSRQMLSAWAAYQHYGDPTDVVEPFERTGNSPRDPGAGR